MRLQRKKWVATSLITSLLVSLTTGAWADTAAVDQQLTGNSSDSQPAIVQSDEQQSDKAKKTKVAVIEIQNQAPDAVLVLRSKADEELTLVAIPKDKDGNELEEGKVHWKSDNKKVASVDKNGRVTAEGLGTTEIIAMLENVSARFQVTVKESSDIDKEQAIRDANEAILALPALEQLTLADKPAVTAAREKVTQALAKGAQESDITNLPALVVAEEKITQLEQEAADVASDKEALSIGYAEGDSADSLTADVTLPTSGENGSAISWQTSDAAVVEANGTVHRPASGSGDRQVTLTATVTKGSTTDTKTFQLTVKELPASASLSVEKEVIREAEANDGSISDQQTLVLSNGTFAQELTKADVTMKNLPEGLDFDIAGLESSRLTISFTGKAVNHFDTNDQERVSVTVAREKVTGAADNVTSPEFAIDFIDPAAISIAEAKPLTGQTVTVKGIVTADNSAIGGSKLSTYIQEDGAGINVFSTNLSAFPDLKEGDQVFVTGKITIYRGLTEIVPQAGGLQVVSRGNPLPTATETSIETLNDSAEAEPLEGTLVKLTGYISNIPGTPAGGGYNISLIDSQFKGITFRVIENSLDIGQLEVGKWYEITGIVGQFDSGYQLLPRKQADVVLLQNQPDPPDSRGTYDSVVKDVVDGDTIHLTQPVLGATTVRYVNIDTPETYHVVHSPADQNQKDQGERAKQYLKNLLVGGDQVQVKVGIEAKDDYGRLLGEVIRKNDGLLTNLEMVRQGYASTYFIWPIDEDAYELYQQAVKEAELNGLGIWNPNDPLMELPFVFRAREQQKGLTRQVGNHLTKKYVGPEDWMAVPVEQRVFFSSEQEAEEQGYSPMESDLLADALAVADGKSALTLTYDGQSSAINLPTAGTEGTTVSWSLKDPAQADIINVETGEVNRSALQNDTEVIVIAAISKGSSAQQKGFPVLVKKLSTSDEQAVAEAKAALQISYDGVAATVSLPITGAADTAIGWTLQNPAQAAIVNVETGEVNRSGLTANTEVVLIATISKGSAQDTKTFTITVKADQPGGGTSDLIFSEYLEGTSNNKALEIFNGTGAAIDLAANKYTVALYSNGSATPGSTFALSGTLADGATYVIANASANATILAKAQATSSVTNFNGDDAIVLFKQYDPATKTGTVLDVIGVVGFDPGTAWGTTVKTLDQTLVRKASIHVGNTNTAGPFDPAVDWESKGLDYFDGLGSHTIVK